jgi:hypothetical protein
MAPSGSRRVLRLWLPKSGESELKPSQSNERLRPTQTGPATFAYAPALRYLKVVASDEPVGLNDGTQRDSMCSQRRPCVHFHALRRQRRAGHLDKRPGWKGARRYVRIVEVVGCYLR